MEGLCKCYESVPEHFNEYETKLDQAEKSLVSKVENTDKCPEEVRELR